MNIVNKLESPYNTNAVYNESYMIHTHKKSQIFLSLNLALFAF